MKYLVSIILVVSFFSACDVNKYEYHSFKGRLAKLELEDKKILVMNGAKVTMTDGRFMIFNNVASCIQKTPMACGDSVIVYYEIINKIESRLDSIVAQ